MQELTPLSGSLVWTTAEIQAAREVHLHFQGRRLEREQMRQPDRWTLFNWECLAYIFQYVSQEAHLAFMKDFAGMKTREESHEKNPLQLGGARGVSPSAGMNQLDLSDHQDERTRRCHRQQRQEQRERVRSLPVHLRAVMSMEYVTTFCTLTYQPIFCTLHSG